MVINNYENKRMVISPKSKKIATSCVDVILTAEKGNNILKQRKKGHKTSTIISGFKFADLAPKTAQLKKKKKRTKNNKFVGTN